MTDYKFVKTEPWHCEMLADRMKKSDVDEIWAFSRQRPIGALKVSMLYSIRSYTVFVDGEVEMMFGIASPSLLSRTAAPWMLSSDAVFQKKHRSYFLKRSKRFFRWAKVRYPAQSNWADSRNKRTIRWLEWLGYSISPAEAVGRDDIPFHRFFLAAEES